MWRVQAAGDGRVGTAWDTSSAGRAPTPRPTCSEARADQLAAHARTSSPALPALPTCPAPHADHVRASVGFAHRQRAHVLACCGAARGSAEGAGWAQQAERQRARPATDAPPCAGGLRETYRPAPCGLLGVRCHVPRCPKESERTIQPYNQPLGHLHGTCEQLWQEAVELLLVGVPRELRDAQVGVRPVAEGDCGRGAARGGRAGASVDAERRRTPRHVQPHRGMRSAAAHDRGHTRVRGPHLSPTPC